VGQLQAGAGRNIVADWAELKLETRGETSELNDYMVEEAVRIIEGCAALYDVAPQWQLVGHGIDAACSPELIARVERVAMQMDGVSSFVPTMHFGASEDATYMLRRVKERGGLATFMLFGSPLKMWHHQAGFDFDEDVLPLAAELLFRLVNMGER
jgi:aminobenzoyl-glutamate utilization protein A